MKYTVIWIFIIELASEASQSKLLKIQDELTKIYKDTQTEEVLKPMWPALKVKTLKYKDLNL